MLAELMASSRINTCRSLCHSARKSISQLWHYPHWNSITTKRPPSYLLRTAKRPSGQMKKNILEVTSIIGTMQLNVADIDKISFRQQKKASPKGLLKSGAMPKKNLAWISPLSLNNPSCKRVPALVESTPYHEAFHHQAYQANPRIRLRHSHF